MTKMSSLRPVNPSFLKKQAKKINQIHSCGHAKALDLAAQQFGYQNWAHFLNNSPKEAPEKRAQIPQRMNNFVISQNEFNALDSLDFGAWEPAIRYYLDEDEAKGKAILEKCADESGNDTFRGWAISFLVDEFDVPFAQVHPKLNHLSDEGIKIVGQELLETLIQEELESYYMNDGYVQVDEFSSHTEIEEVYVDDFEYDVTPEGLRVNGSLSVAVLLGYGSRGDYDQSSHSFGGEFTVEIDLDRNVSLINAQIDPSSFYGTSSMAE